MRKFVEFINAARKQVAARIHLILLGLFPFADQIISVIGANLPAAAAYLPANVYKWVGLVVVFANVVRDLLKPKAPQ